ncbi:DNA polymerase III subunit alpha [Candidatus Accumulibacter vicinus]|uniref:DNA polymerase III subunit alpha n=1 Tax=Candidatus Accumulibacter vicinus TaxID=2954382 RepID=A0A084XYQ9_9PROT|nr:DNA polymerase III subunit alpha [Candidatus Accumulibacter vicinus]KFB67603.1 MAG: DNA polymerase III subunit alpha [Candidatus Accumulibacter vicinus]
MLESPFIHLRLHSEYSITDGIVRLDDAVDRAARYGMPALALTDLANLFGLVKFYSSARSRGIKPIFGSDVWIANDSDPDRPYRLLLLCRSRQGYLQLCELLSRAYLAPRVRGRAEITRRMLQEIGVDGLIALSGAAAGDVGEALLQGNYQQAASRARQWEQLFPAAFYLEVQRYGQAQQELLVSMTADLAADLELPLVATHPVQFLERDDFKAHEARVCIAEGYMLGDPRRPRLYTEEQYFKSAGEMVELFADFPEALENSVEIAKRCNLQITLGKSYLPAFPTPDGVTLDDYLRQEAVAGLELRLQQLFPDPAERLAERPPYDARLQLETDTIVQMGFPGYFLIVADFINWAKHNGCPVGPGRGSGAGSVVAYALGITDLDPLRYALLFERFLNPERVSMPDFDIDFCQDNRWRVIEYVRRKYGAAAVSQIVTFGTMSSKAVIRDVGRVLDLPYNFCDQLAKLIPVETNKPLSLAKAIAAEPQLKARINDEEEVRDLFDLAARLEDLTRNVGMHAGGVLIAPGKLTDFCPVYSADGGGSVVSQYDKDDVEKVGLVKFDFLGLRNLTIIKLALDYVEKLSGQRPDLTVLSFDDPLAYQILKDGNTTAIFQVESEGMKKLVRKLAPDRFEDIIAVLALYRPGPLGSGMVDDFILRKKGQQKIDYYIDDLKVCLEPTYGVIVYQEQVMQIAQIIGGYTLGAADLLRRAMGKKKAEEMALHRDLMREGARKKGHDEKLAMQLFDLMEKFAEYGFNKSHTAAYAVVTYHTAWLKAHHCAAFMAATLSSDMDVTDTVKIVHDDAIANGLRILGPDVNASEYRFTPVDRSTIRYGLGAVKGTGEQAVNAILRVREAGGPFKDLFDFCRRADKRLVNRRTIEALIRAGGFDSLDSHRARLLASVGIAMEAAEQAERNAMQVSLFDIFDVGEQGGELGPRYVEVPRWSERQQLNEEKLALGFYFSGHPFHGVQAEVSRFVRKPLAALEARKESQWLAGLVVGVRSKFTARGKMAFIQLDDGTSSIEVSVFNELLEAERAKIREDEVLIIEGRVQRDDFAGEGRVKIVAEHLWTLAEARGRFARHLRLSLNGQANGSNARTAVHRLQTLLAPYTPGDCPVRLAYRNGNATCELAFGDANRVRLEDDLLTAVREWLGSDNVSVDYA